MAEYIKRNVAIEAAKHAWDKGLEPSQYIEIIPLADVAPVRHGLWEKVAWWQHQNRYECNECSVCGCRVKPKFTYNYCPHCGCKMDLEG